MGKVFILLILGFPTVVSWATSLKAQNVWNQTALVALWWAQFSSTAAGSWPCDTFKVNLTLSQSGHHISGPNWNCPSFRAPFLRRTATSMTWPKLASAVDVAPWDPFRLSDSHGGSALVPWFSVIMDGCSSHHSWGKIIGFFTHTSNFT